MEFAKISVILIGMDIHMILGEAWNVIPSKCQLEYPFTATWHGMDIHMILGEAWNVIPSKCHLPLNG